MCRCTAEKRTPFCGACKRKLRTKESKEIGYGPVCARAHQSEIEYERIEAQGQMRLL